MIPPQVRSVIDELSGDPSYVGECPECGKSFRPFRILRAAQVLKNCNATVRLMSKEEEDKVQKSLKRLTWQYENCLSCVWFSPTDPINADILERGKCIHPKLKPFDLIVSGRDWCNLYTEIRQKQIDLLQERAMKAEETGKK